MLSMWLTKKAENILYFLTVTELSYNEIVDNEEFKLTSDNRGLFKIFR